MTDRLVGLPLYLSLSEVAELARVSYETVRWWVWKGRLPVHKAGGRGRPRVRRDELLAFLDARGESPQPSQGAGHAAPLAPTLANSAQRSPTVANDGPRIADEDEAEVPQ